MKYLLTSTLFLFASIAFGQIDSTYYKRLTAKRIIGVHVGMNRFEVSLPTTSGEDVYFFNHTIKAGPRIKFGKFRASFSLPVASFNPYGEGRGKSFGLSLGFYPKSIYLNLDLRNHRGMNLPNIGEIQPSRAFREDIKATFISLRGGYVFNGDKYSLRSAFKMIDRQLRSAGSWLTAGGIEYLEFLSRFGIVGIVAEDLIKRNIELKGVNTNGGYDDWIIHKNGKVYTINRFHTSFFALLARQVRAFYAEKNEKSLI